MWSMTWANWLFFPLLLLLRNEPSQPVAIPPAPRFRLRHLHGLTNSSTRVIFSNVAPIATDTLENTSESYSVPATRLTTYRPSSAFAYQQARLSSSWANSSLRWSEETVVAPDVERREVLLELAKMTNNAYLKPGESGWYDLGDGWSPGYQFGWEPDDDGFRGHVFATDDNSTIVLSIKGTSAGLFGRGGPTAARDKLNDNLLFSCCCARIDWSWTPVCNCYRGGQKCDVNCLEDALREESLFYPIGMDLYNNLTFMYPNANIWVIGHSLGGSLASLIGATFGPPVVTFESPPAKLAAKRLHLPLPPSTNHITHVFHTADPIAMGTCNGIFSSCALGGFAMETRCRLGRTIRYDTVSQKGWTVDVRTHGIVAVIERLLSEPWSPSVQQGREVPEPVVETDCVECYNWEFGDFPL